MEDSEYKKMQNTREKNIGSKCAQPHHRRGFVIDKNVLKKNHDFDQHPDREIKTMCAPEG